jgi:hypothetical protein
MPNFDTVLLINKTDANHKMTFEFFTTKFYHARWKQKQPFTFWYCAYSFYPRKDIIVGKRCRSLRSIAELSAFYGTEPAVSRLTSVVSACRLKRTADMECGTDSTPLDGTACVGGPGSDSQHVCGQCGVLFDVSYPLGAHMMNPWISVKLIQ